jgi:hypothetical protein
MLKFDEFYLTASGAFKKQTWLLKSFSNQMTIKDFEAKVKSTKSTISDYYSTQFSETKVCLTSNPGLLTIVGFATSSKTDQTRMINSI